MTDDPDNTPEPGSPEAAINEVLAAEQAAAEAIEACQQDARASLHEAAQQARRIAKRTDERIALIHQRVRQQLQRHLRDAEHSARAAEQARDSEEPRMAVIDTAVNDLAARLTGGDSSDPTQAD